MAAGPSFADVPQRDAPSQGSLVGPDEGAPQTQTAPSDQQERNRNFTAGIKNLHKQLDDVARQYPDMSEFCDKAKKALTDGMVRHMSSSARESSGMQAPPLAG